MTPTVRAWAILLGFGVAVAFGDALVLWHHVGGAPHGYQYWLECTLGISFSTALAAILVARRPGHPFTRIVVAAAAVSSTQLVAGAFASAATLVSLPRPAVVLAAYLSATAQAAIVGLLLIALLVAPTGRLPSRRWLTLAATIVIAAVALAFSSVAAPDMGQAVYLANNPLASVVPASWTHLVQTVGGLAGGPAVLAAVTALVLRWRTTSGEARQQVKLVVAAGVAGVGCILLYTVAQSHLPASHQVGSVVWALAAASIPAATTASILRHGLYEIDRVVSRTVSYIVVTGLLVAFYLGLVLAAESLLGHSSSLLVAASTLAAAALFYPVRQRVQRRVDHRFNRARYDADRAVEQFAARMRDQLDVNVVSSQLTTVAARALQPTKVSVWLRN